MNEISLFDLWAVLVRRRLVIVAVTGLMVVVGALYGFLKEPEYQYSAAIQMGRVPDGAGPDGIFSATEALAAMRAVHLPDAIEEAFGTDETARLPRIRAMLEEGDGIIVLSGQTVESEGPLYRSVMKKAASGLMEAHRARLEAVRELLKATLEQVRDQVELTMREGKELRGSLAKLDQLRDSLESQIVALGEELATLRAQRAGLVDGEEIRDGSVQPLLALNQSIAEILGQLTELKASSDVSIVKRRDELLEKIAAKERSGEALRLNAVQLESQLEQLTPTRMARSPQSSLRAVGPGPVTVTVLAAVLGLLLGVVAAFLSEFLSRSRALLAAEKGGGP